MFYSYESIIEQLAKKGDFFALKGMLDKVKLDEDSFLHEQKETFLVKFFDDSYSIVAFVCFLKTFEADEFDLSKIESLTELKDASPTKGKAFDLFMSSEAHELFSLVHRETMLRSCLSRLLS